MISSSGIILSISEVDTNPKKSLDDQVLELLESPRFREQVNRIITARKKIQSSAENLREAV